MEEKERFEGEEKHGSERKKPVCSRIKSWRLERYCQLPSVENGLRLFQK